MLRRGLGTATLAQAEEDFFALGLGGGDGRVERVDDGRGDAEVADDGGGKRRLERFRRRERGGEAPLAALDEIKRGVIFGEAFGRAGERVAFEFFERAADRRAAQELAEFGVVIEEPVADGGELVFFRHVRAGGDDELLGRDMEVVAGAGGFAQPLVRPPGGDVAFVGALVVAEAGVAVDAEHALFRGAHVVGSEVEHGLGDFADDGEHRLFELGFVDGLARSEPGAVVVAGEVAQEGEGCGAEVGEGGRCL